MHLIRLAAIGSALFLLVGSSSSFGADIPAYNKYGIMVTLEPIIGWENLPRTIPDDHTKGLLIYGGRALVGTKLLSAEFEYTTGNDTESFSAPVETVKTKIENGRAGFRSTPTLSKLVGAILRTGIQGTRLTQDVTDANGVVSDSAKWTYRPYVGAGLELFVVRAFSVIVEATYLVDSIAKLSQNATQYTAGGRIYF